MVVNRLIAATATLTPLTKTCMSTVSYTCVVKQNAGDIDILQLMDVGPGPRPAPCLTTKQLIMSKSAPVQPGACLVQQATASLTYAGLAGNGHMLRHPPSFILIHVLSHPQTAKLKGALYGNWVFCWLAMLWYIYDEYRNVVVVRMVVLLTCNAV